jgi:hypothetical protein
MIAMAGALIGAVGTLPELFRLSYWLGNVALVYLFIGVKITMKPPTPSMPSVPAPSAMVTCLHCQNRFPVPDALQGHTIRCVVCGVEQKVRTIQSPGGSS